MTQSLLTPAPLSLSSLSNARTGQSRGCTRASVPRNSSYGSSSCGTRQPCLLDSSSQSLSSSFDFSTHQSAVPPPGFSPSHRACPEVPRVRLFDSRVINKIRTMSHGSPFCKKKKEAIRDALNQRKVALISSRKPLEEEAIALPAKVSALSNLDKQVPDSKAQNSSLEKVNQKLMQEALSDHYKNTGKNPDCLAATVFTGML